MTNISGASQDNFYPLLSQLHSSYELIVRVSAHYHCVTLTTYLSDCFLCFEINKSPALGLVFILRVSFVRHMVVCQGLEHFADAEMKVVVEYLLKNA